MGARGSTKRKPIKLRPNKRPITVTIAHAREISGLGNSTIWKLISEGRLDTVSIGRRRLVLYDSLERLLSPQADGVVR
jgi:hypothetical protein